MERTEELLRIVELFRTDLAPGTELKRKGDVRPSQYLNLAQRVAANIESNEALVRRMDKLSARKEFSNDPTVEMTEISDLFHMKVAVIQREFETLRKITEDRHHEISDGQQQMQHYKLLMQVLNKRHLQHIESFKKALKVHSEHVQQRQKRVVKYGQGLDQIRAGSGRGGADMSNTSYAMFSSPMINMAEVQKTQELRRRPVTGPTDDSGGMGISGNSAQTGVQNINLKSPSKGGGDNGRYNGSSSSGYMERKERDKSYGGAGGQGGSSGGQYMQMQLQQQQRPTRDMSARVQGAEKVEKAISQMGQLFAQMATLVLEQSETLTRIEDDVEIGLSDTKEAHTSMTNLYDITKGNRSMIVKIFLLLIFFIFLFLVWT